jgi:hypothetical protein
LLWGQDVGGERLTAIGVVCKLAASML